MDETLSGKSPSYQLTLYFDSIEEDNATNTSKGAFH